LADPYYKIGCWSLESINFKAVKIKDRTNNITDHFRVRPLPAHAATPEYMAAVANQYWLFGYTVGPIRKTKPPKTTLKLAIWGFTESRLAGLQFPPSSKHDRKRGGGERDGLTRPVADSSLLL
jgi:hypothetical protein